MFLNAQLFVADGLIDISNFTYSSASACFTENFNLKSCFFNHYVLLTNNKLFQMIFSHQLKQTSYCCLYVWQTINILWLQANIYNFIVWKKKN